MEMTPKTTARGEEGGNPVLRFDGERLNQIDIPAVREAAIALNVNGVELATLIGSPHDLNYLVAGFLRTQGLIRTVDDICTLGVCDDLTVAKVKVKGEVPRNLKPVLTSGCGAGIDFTLPGLRGTGARPATGDGWRCRPSEIFFMMGQLTQLAERYKRHGGVHSAAVGDGKRVILYAEDIGRHNTLDRIAGEALLKDIDIAGNILVTSGRVSSEMAAKSAALGISLIASRTSPTDMAIRICSDFGITLVGYVRGRRFNAYTHPGRVSAPRG